jgi:hypothetical protein
MSSSALLFARAHAALSGSSGAHFAPSLVVSARASPVRSPPAQPGTTWAEAPTQPIPFAVGQSHMRITQRIKRDRTLTTALDHC